MAIWSLAVPMGHPLTRASPANGSGGTPACGYWGAMVVYPRHIAADSLGASPRRLGAVWACQHPGLG